MKKTNVQKPKIQIITPQFEREPGATPPADYATIEFALLKHADYETMKSLGMRAWNDPLEDDIDSLRKFEGKRLMLFPGEWYAHIPEGFEVVTINGVRKKFVRGQTDDDVRFSCLAYGVLV